LTIQIDLDDILMASLRDFIPLEKLGEGSFSTVYKVKRVSDGKLYALKKVQTS
jgi:NIMA (never in mitosis gene a)-related kinase